MADKEETASRLGIDEFGALNNLFEKIINTREQLGDNPVMEITGKVDVAQLGNNPKIEDGRYIDIEQLKEDPNLMVVSKKDYDGVLESTQKRMESEVRWRRCRRAIGEGKRILTLALIGLAVLKPDWLQALNENIPTELVIPLLLGIYAMLHFSAKGDDEKSIHNSFQPIVDKVIALYNNRKVIKETEMKR